MTTPVTENHTFIVHNGAAMPLMLNSQLAPEFNEHADGYTEISLGNCVVVVSPDSREFLDPSVMESLVYAYRNVFATSPKWNEGWHHEGDSSKTCIPLHEIAQKLGLSDVTSISQIENHPRFNELGLRPFHDPNIVRNQFQRHFETKTPSILVFDEKRENVVAFALTSKQYLKDVIAEYQDGMGVGVGLPFWINPDQEVISFAELGIDTIRFPHLPDGLVFNLFGCLAPLLNARIRDGVDSPETLIFNWTLLVSAAAPLIIGSGFRTLWNNNKFVVSAMSVGNFVSLFGGADMYKRDGSVNARAAFNVLKDNLIKSYIMNMPFVGPRVLGPLLNRNVVNAIKKYLKKHKKK